MIVFARNLVAKDFWLKLFSLALAVLIWLTVKFSTSGENPTSPWLALIGGAGDEVAVTVPVHMPPGGAQIFKSVPAEVQVWLRGDPKLLTDLPHLEIKAEVDLTGVESANGLLRPVEVILPKGLSYTRVVPEQVEVQVSRKPE